MLRAELHSVQVSEVNRSDLICTEKRFFKRFVVVVQLKWIPQDMRRVCLSVQVNERTRAFHERLSKKEMDGLLRGDVTVCSHPGKQALNGTLGRLIERKTRAKFLQNSVIRLRK